MSTIELAALGRARQAEPIREVTRHSSANCPARRLQNTHGHKLELHTIRWRIPRSSRT